MADPQAQQFQYVKLPDGSYGKFDANASDDLIKQTISQNFPDAYKQQPVSQPQPDNRPFWDLTRANDVLKKIPGAEAVGQFGIDFGHGINKGIMQGPTSLAEGLNKLPWVGKYLAPTEGVQAMKSFVQSKNMGEAVGKGAEQTGEFALPGAQEEKLATGIASKLPFLGKFAQPAAKVAAAAGVTGAVNKYQGGDFSTGAAFGAGGNLIGQGAAAIAPKIADTALGIRRTDRMRGKIPGAAVLAETTGINPADIAQQSADKTGLLNNQLQSAASQSTAIAGTTGATQILDSEIANAAKQNNKPLYTKLNQLKSQLTQDFRTGQPFPADDSPDHILALKRGIGDLVSSWNPKENPKSLDSVVKRVYGALDSELDRTVPGAQQLNDRMASLIPVTKRAEEMAAGEDMMQRVIKRAAVHTGASATGLMGAYGGYKEGGVPGAVAGGAAGLLGPEVLGSPTAKMAVARGFASPSAQSVIRAGVGAGLQANRKKKGSAFYGDAETH